MISTKIATRLTVLVAALLGLAFSAQSFNTKQDSVKKAENKQTVVRAAHFLVNKGAYFSPRISVNPSKNCMQADQKYCVYQLTEEGEGQLPNQQLYSPAEIELFEANEWIEPHPESGLALYLN